MTQFSADLPPDSEQPETTDPFLAELRLPEPPSETSKAEYIDRLHHQLEFMKGLSKGESRLLHLIEVLEVGYEAACNELNLTPEDLKQTLLKLRVRRNQMLNGPENSPEEIQGSEPRQD